MRYKGAVVISETMLLAFGIVVSFVLLATMGSMIMKGQSEPAEESAMLLVAKDIACTIDRVAAEAGSVAIVYRVPKGMKVDVGVDYKLLKVTAGDKTYGAPFQALTHTKPYMLSTPRYMCFVKNQDDMRISLSKDKCICNTNDNRCDPACVVSADCDPDCNMDDVEDRVCDSRCSAAGDNICDPDCFTSDKDKVNEAVDCIKDFEEDGNGYKRSKDKDRICDADSHMVEDAMCDIDCLNNGTSSWGICDPDCSKYDMTNVSGIMVSEDGFCDLDCGYSGTLVKRLHEDGVCDLDCAGPVNSTTGDWLDRVENGICDPDCGGLYDPDCGKCGNLGAACSLDVPCCGEEMGLDLACCPGAHICAENKLDGTPACCGNGWCEIGPFSSASENLPENIAKWSKGMEGTHPKNWENEHTCPDDCANRADGICYGYKSCAHPDRPDWDPDCTGSGNGCGYWCLHAYNGDPDCMGVRPDPSEGGDGFCLSVQDSVCDDDCPTSDFKQWDPDCTNWDCGKKVDIGQWTKSVVDDGGEVWYADALEVCDDEVVKFLDRRGWDIGQVIRNWDAETPDGWGFDATRYSAALVQPASETIAHNEDYFTDFNDCCPDEECYGTCAPRGGVPTIRDYDKCCKVGFCGDHSAAVTSVLRTLGVPAYNAWSALFNAGGGAGHAWNLLHCDSSIEYLGKYGTYKLFQEGKFIIDECNAAGDGEWIVVDATGHGVFPLKTATGQSYCTAMKDLWNDDGRYAFQGIVCDGTSVIATDTNCEVSGSNVLCECQGCSGCVINHPHANQEGCTVSSGQVSCPFRRNPQEAGNSMGC